MSLALAGRFFTTVPPGKFGGFPGDSEVKNPPANAGVVGLNPGQEYPLEKEMAKHSSNSCMQNSMNRRAWRAMVHGVRKE